MSKRKLFHHNDDFINGKAEEKAEELWAELNKNYPLHESKLLADKLKTMKPLTYSYLEGFVGFQKKFDDKFCLTPIPKTQDFWMAKNAISKCLANRGWKLNKNRGDRKLSRSIIYYVDYQFDIDYNCPHGPEYKDVYLMFFTKSEDAISKSLDKFDKLKVFI